MDHRRRSLAGRYRFIAVLALARWILLLAGLGCLGFAYRGQDTMFLLPAAICGVAFLLTLVVFMIEAGRVRCQMCRAVLLRSMSCEKHPQAKRLAGSATLRTTLAIVLSPAKIRCHYCDGQFRLSGRGSHRQRPPADPRPETSAPTRSVNLPASRIGTTLPPKR